MINNKNLDKNQALDTGLNDLKAQGLDLAQDRVKDQAQDLAQDRVKDQALDQEKGQGVDQATRPTGFLQSILNSILVNLGLK